jgi:hypothetical protein
MDAVIRKTKHEEGEVEKQQTRRRRRAADGVPSYVWGRVFV